MTARQRKFAEYYAKSGNATQSAVKAGYSKKFAHTNASRFLNVEEVKAYVRELTEKGQRERIMSALERQARCQTLPVIVMRVCRQGCVR